MSTSSLAPTRARSRKSCRTEKASWSKEEDELLTKLVNSSSTTCWSSFEKYFPNKTASQLSGRWEKVLNPRLVKGSWTQEEDETIIEFVKENGDKEWAKLALMLNGRIGKQCRERWKNHLDPSVNRAAWSEEEDNLLIELHEAMGNTWTRISKYFPGRTDNCVKNRWNSTIKRRLERLKNGEPLTKKRGRKPKNHNSVPKPDFDQERDPSSETSAFASSPIREPVVQPNVILGFNPLAERLSLLIPPLVTDFELTSSSLQQNRMNLEKLLFSSN